MKGSEEKETELLHKRVFYVNLGFSNQETWY